MEQLIISNTTIVCFIDMLQAGAKVSYKQFIHNHVSNLMTLDQYIYIYYMTSYITIL